MRQDYFEFSNNVKILSGEGAIDQLATLLPRLGGYRVFIVSDNVIKKTGHLDSVKKAISSVKELAIGGEYLNVESTCTIKDLDDMYLAFRKSGADAIVGVGGTRVMNAAKALYLLISTKSKSIVDFRGIDAAVRTNYIPFFLIPTTFGSGGEVSKTIVVIDEEHNEPIEIVTGALQPHYCLLEPEFLKTLPEKEIYMSLIDIMAYTIESYISTRATPLTRSFSKMAMFLVKDNFQKGITEGDIDSLTNLQQAAVIAAIAYSNTYTGIAHAVANTLAAKFNMHRGEAICATLRAILDDLKELCKDKFSEMLLYYRGTQEYATITNDERCEVFIRVINNIIERLAEHYGVKTKLSDYGVKEEDLEPLAEAVLTAGEIIVCPKQYKKEEVVEILRKSL